jgi:hypothetical protein
MKRAADPLSHHLIHQFSKHVFGNDSMLFREDPVFVAVDENDRWHDLQVKPIPKIVSLASSVSL